MTRWSEDQYKAWLASEGKRRGVGKPLLRGQDIDEIRKRIKASKYKNEKTEVNGIKFDSKKEAGRYEELFFLQQVGEIKELKLQPRYELQPAYEKNGKKIRKIEYVADFEYIDKDGKTIVEDVKGVKTAVYQLKKKMFEYKYPELEITEI